MWPIEARYGGGERRVDAIRLDLPSDGELALHSGSW
jgi:hypothetical protein